MARQIGYTSVQIDSTIGGMRKQILVKKPIRTHLFSILQSKTRGTLWQTIHMISVWEQESNTKTLFKVNVLLGY